MNFNTKKISKKKTNKKQNKKKTKKTGKQTSKRVSKTNSKTKSKKLDHDRLINVKIVKRRSFYKSFENIISMNIVLRYIQNELNSDQVLLELDIVNTYKKIVSNFFYEFRLINEVILSPYPVINVNSYLDNYYKNNPSGSICVISNMYSQLIPFISLDINVNIIGKLKKNKILLFKNDYIANFSKNYENIKDHLKIASRNIAIEGSFEYDINNYLNNYVLNNNLYEKKYDMVYLITGYYMELRYPKLTNYILTGLFNLKKGGKLTIYTSLLIKIDKFYDLFVLLSTIFAEYKIIKHENNDYLTDYSYYYEFIDYQELSNQKLLEFANIILNKNPNDDLNLQYFLNFTKTNIDSGNMLLTSIINEANKYAYFMENNINYFSKEPLSYVKFYVKFIMNRLFLIFNNGHKITSLFNMNLIYKIIQKYHKNICCIVDYYKNLTINLFKSPNDINLDINYFNLSNAPYHYDLITSLIYNIDIQKKITISSIKKILPKNRFLLINNDIDKNILIDIIIDYYQNLPINQPKIINDSSFIEHWELLNEFNLINKIIKDGEKNGEKNGEKDKENKFKLKYLHFGNNDSQFMSSLKYMIDNKYKGVALQNNYMNFKEISNKKHRNGLFNIITCDDIQDLEINGNKIWNIDGKYEEDTINSAFTIITEEDKKNMDKKIKEFELYELKKVYNVISLMEFGGSCYIKHVAIPLNSYLYYNGYANCSGFFINYLYLYFLMFEKIILFRPTTIANKSLEFYVIGINFNGFDATNTTNTENMQKRNDILEMLSKILENYELHKTLFKKEMISEMFVEQVMSFLNIITSRYIKFEEIKGMLSFTVINKYNEKIQDDNDDLIVSKIVNKNEVNEINQIFLSKKLLNDYLTKNIYNNWKTKYIDIITNYKLYYFSQIEKSNKILDKTFDFSILQNNLDKYKFIKLNNKNDIIGLTNQVSYMHFYLPGKKLFIPENLTLINLLDSQNIVNKNILYELCLHKNKSITKKDIIESFTIQKNKLINGKIKEFKQLFDENVTFNIKMYYENSNNNTLIINSFNELTDLVNTINNNINHDYTLILNKWINNPLLFKKNKFYIRIFYIPFINNDKIIKSYISKYGFMFLIKDSKMDESILIKKSKETYSDNDYIFPNDFKEEFGNNKFQKVSEQIINILHFISKVQSHDIYNYMQTKNGYEILGADFIIDDNFNVKLLEINNNIKLYANRDENKQFMSEYLFTNIYNEIVSNVFDLNKINYNDEFIIL
jgi:hypothetical protein